MIPRAYPGTKILIGHFWPHLSIALPRTPAVKDPASELRPSAKPAQFLGKSWENLELG